MPPTPMPPHAHAYAYHQSPQRVCHLFYIFLTNLPIPSFARCAISNDDASTSERSTSRQLREWSTSGAYGRRRTCMMKLGPRWKIVHVWLLKSRVIGLERVFSVYLLVIWMGSCCDFHFRVINKLQCSWRAENITVYKSKRYHLTSVVFFCAMTQSLSSSAFPSNSSLLYCNCIESMFPIPYVE